MPSKRGPGSVQIKVPMRDAWLRRATPRGLRTWAGVKRQFRAFLPAGQSRAVCATLQKWGASPNNLAPLLRLIGDIALSNAVHRAHTNRAKWAAGTARDAHYKATPEVPGALRPLLEIVERVIVNLEQFIDWQFTPPIELHELDAQHRPTGRTVRLARPDEDLRAAATNIRRRFEQMRDALRKDSRRVRGRKATIVQPYPVSARSMSSTEPKVARRRDLVRMVRAEILHLHPKRAADPRAARAQAERLARGILDAIPVLN